MPTVSTPPAAPYRGRFAPSPTGDLHAGSLLAALGSWLLARRSGGTWLVRIEDLDPPREVVGAARRQLDALAAFGLHADGPVEFQSRRHAHYREALDRLLATGAAFECHCTRSDLATAGGVHRRCVARAPRPSPALRLRVRDGANVAFVDGLLGLQRQRVDRDVGDVVLRRADGLWAYQLAVVVDDAAQGVTDVVRGADLLDSTPRQVLVQRALGLPTPRYLHLPLVVTAEGQKLSKSEGAEAIDPARPLPALDAAWHRLGQAEAAVAGSRSPEQWLDRALAAFDPARLRAAATSHLHS